MTKRINVGNLLRIALYLFIAFIGLRGHPPASAQQESAKDAVQDNRIDRAEGDVKDLTAKDQKLWEVVNANTTAISDWNAQFRFGIGAIGFLQIGIGIWQKKKNPA